MGTQHPKQQRIGKQDMAMLEDISAEDMIFGFLTSAGSTTIAYRQARRRAQSRYEHARRADIQRRLDGLEQKNLITIEQVNDDEKQVQLTDQGRLQLDKYTLVHTYQTIKQDFDWDGIWRIVMFDIPQERKAYRWELRHLLQECGFMQVQQSVYVAPYPCKELREYIACNRMIGSYVHIIKGEYVGNDTKLRRQFEL